MSRTTGTPAPTTTATVAAPLPLDRTAHAPRGTAGVLALCCCLHGLAASSVASTIPTIAATLHTSTSAAEGVVTAFFIGAAVAVLVAGRAADVFGARRLLLASLVLVAMASAAAGFAASLPWLIGARAVLGAATATIYPAAIAVLAARNAAARAPSTAGMAAIVAASEVLFGAGPALGGVLTTAAGWRVACLLIAPIALVAAVLVWRRIPAAPTGPTPERDNRTRRDKLAELDPVGAVIGTAVAGMCVLWLLVPVRITSWTAAIPTVLLVLVAALILHSRRHKTPFLALEVIASRRIRVGLTRTALTYLAVYLLVYGLPLAMAHTGWTATATGLAMLPVAAVSAVAVVIARRSLRRTGPNRPLLMGALALEAIALGLVLLANAGAGTPSWAVVALFVVLGVACGACNLVTQHNALAASPADRTGGVASWGRCMQFVAGQVSSVLVTLAAPATEHGMRLVAIGVLACGLGLAATAAPSVLGWGPR